MYCGNCGKQIPDGLKFCPLCGAALSAAQPPEPAPAAAPPQEPQEIWSNSAPQGYPVQEPRPQSAPYQSAPQGYPVQEPQPQSVPYQSAPQGYPVQEPQPRNMPYPGAPYPAVPPQDAYPQNTPWPGAPAPEEKKKTWVPIVITVCVLAVAAAVFAVLYFAGLLPFSPGKGDSGAPSSSVSEAYVPSASAPGKEPENKPKPSASPTPKPADAAPTVSIPVSLIYEEDGSGIREEYLPRLTFYPNGTCDMFINYGGGVTTLNVPCQLYTYAGSSRRVIKLGPCEDFSHFSGARTSLEVFLVETAGGDWSFCGENVGLTRFESRYADESLGSVSLTATPVDVSKLSALAGDWEASGSSGTLHVSRVDGGLVTCDVNTPIAHSESQTMICLPDGTLQGFLPIDHSGDQLCSGAVSFSEKEVRLSITLPDKTSADYAMKKAAASDAPSANVSAPYSLPTFLEGYYVDTGEIYQTIQAEYDKAGNMVWFMRERGDEEEQWIYEYDSNGCLTDGYHYLNGDYTGGFRGTYDSTGHPILEEHLNAGGDVLFSLEYAYDAQGRRIREAIHSGIALPDVAYEGEIVEYTYNEKGQVSKVKDSLPNGTVLYEITPTYDAKGNLVREEDANKTDGGTDIYTMEYDEHGKVQFYYTDSGYVTYYNTYDSKGNLTGYTLFADDNEYASSRREYQVFDGSALKGGSWGTVSDFCYYDTTVEYATRTTVVPIWQKSSRPLLFPVNLVICGCL